MQLCLFAIEVFIPAVVPFFVFIKTILIAIGDRVNSLIVIIYFVIGEEHVLLIQMMVTKHLASVIKAEISGQIDTIIEFKANRVRILKIFYRETRRIVTRRTGSQQRQKRQQKESGFLFHATASLDSNGSSVERSSSSLDSKDSSVEMVSSSLEEACDSREDSSEAE